ncbi:hypothetical protein HMI54_004038 [Coelomomyces lativittatus]|nr:hypothetical protein HMI56_007338 [Coelomomyces lativittatus]KAJ1517784.1 hypothetical protein HMI54_004038 [Coelomomyces lativittatus]KAJ1517985.1 hypothetical protein HMI55_004261 [Coelomomyces lativittatus]
MDLWGLKNNGLWEGDDTEHISKQQKKYTTTTTTTTTSSFLPKSTLSSSKEKDTFQKEGSVETTKSKNGNPSHSSSSTGNEWLTLFKRHGSDEIDKTEQASTGSYRLKPYRRRCQNSVPSPCIKGFQPRPLESIYHDNAAFLCMESEIDSLSLVGDRSNNSTLPASHSKAHSLSTSMDPSPFDNKTTMGTYKKRSRNKNKKKTDISRATTTVSNKTHENIDLSKKEDSSGSPLSFEKDISTSFFSSSNQPNTLPESPTSMVTTPSPSPSKETISPIKKTLTPKDDQKREGVVRYTIEDVLGLKDLLVHQTQPLSVLEKSVSNIRRKSTTGSTVLSHDTHESLAALDHSGGDGGSVGVGGHPMNHCRSSGLSDSNMGNQHGHTHPSEMRGEVPQGSASFGGSSLHGRAMQGSTQFQHPSTHPLHPLPHSNVQSSSNEWLSLFKKHGGVQDDKTELASFRFRPESFHRHSPYFQKSAPSHPSNKFQQRPKGMSGHPYPLFNPPGSQYFDDTTSSHRGNGGPKHSSPNMPMTKTMSRQPDPSSTSQGMAINPTGGGSPNRPVPAFLKFPEEDTKVMTEEEKYLRSIEKETCGLLNKISFENVVEFAPYFYRPEKFVSALKLKIDMIFKKSSNDPKYSLLYAKLANVLLKNCEPLQGSTAENKSFEAIRKNIRKFIMESCRNILKSRPKWAHKMYPKITEADYEEVTKIKEKVLGNMRFVAQLFNYKVLSPLAMSNIVKKLLKNTQTPTEEDLECLIVLLNTVGPLLSTLKDEEVWFKKIDEILRLPPIPPRIRYLLMDLLALKKNDWRTPNAEQLSKQLKEYTTKTATPPITKVMTCSESASSKNQLKKGTENKNSSTPSSFNPFSFSNDGSSTSSASLDSAGPDVEDHSKGQMEKQTKLASTSPVTSTSSGSKNASFSSFTSSSNSYSSSAKSSTSSKNQSKKGTRNKNSSAPSLFNPFSVLNDDSSTPSEPLDSTGPDVKEKSKSTLKKRKSPVEKQNKPPSVSPVSSSSSLRAAVRNETKPSPSPLPATSTANSSLLSETEVKKTVENTLKTFLKNKDMSMILKRFQQLPQTEAAHARIKLTVLAYFIHFLSEESSLCDVRNSLIEHDLWTLEFFTATLLNVSFLEVSKELKTDVPPFLQ